MGEKLSKSDANTNSNKEFGSSTGEGNNNNNNNNSKSNLPKVMRTYAQSRITLATLTENITKKYALWQEEQATLKTSGKLAEIPQDIFRVVLGHMTPWELLQLGHVSKGLYCATTENYLWQHLVEKEFGIEHAVPSEPPFEGFWKGQYLAEGGQKKLLWLHGKESFRGPTVIGPFKYSYRTLAKKGIILDSEVPAMARKKTYFFISSTDINPGVFKIAVRICGIDVDEFFLKLRDLLPRHYDNVTRLELDQVTLDVNLTLRLMLKLFFE